MIFNEKSFLIAEVLNFLKANKYYSERLVHIEELAPKEAQNCEIEGLSEILQNYIDKKQIKPYKHQCQAIDFIRKGFHTIITTPTASGKTFAYNLPVWEALIKDKKATALYIYPTKALTNDQLKVLKDFENITKQKFYPYVYDGDTSSSAKSMIRNKSRIILTNPYELHQILPWNYQWVRFFSNLKFVVLDEAHQYRGVFGSNIAMVLRRLRRIVENYKSKPTFILSSATLANPLEFAYKLTGLYFQLVDTDGAPKGKKFFCFYNPFVSEKIETSTAEETARLFSIFVRKGLKTLVFTQSRRIAEYVAKRARELLAKNYSHLVEKITAYRAGYLPSERRKIEQDFKTGNLLGLSSTNALELGIDIGDLDAVIISGFPGTIISTRQQSGRAGRKGNDALTVLVAYKDKLDQYFMKYPKKFFSSPFEHAIVDLTNPYILGGHLLCAAAEKPFTEKDFDFFPKKDTSLILKSLELKNLLKKTDRGYIYIGKQSPAQAVSLDNMPSEIFKVIYNGKVLETMGKYHAFREAHYQAVLLHRGESYVVNKFDLENQLIYVDKKNVDYHTVALKDVSAEITETLKSRKIGDYDLFFGKLLVREQFYKYKIVRGDEVIGYGDLDLPVLEFETKGIWLTIDKNFLENFWLSHSKKVASIPSLNTASQHFDVLAGGLHGAEHALIGIMPFVVMADRWDLGGVSTLMNSQTGKPTIFIYDGYQGGIGLTEKAFEVFETISQMAFDVVSGCNCKDGCPACIMSPKCGNENRPLDKETSVRILNFLSFEAEN